MKHKCWWLGLFAVAITILAFGGSSRKNKIIFLGDSITQLGVQPGGYITMIQAMMQEQGLEKDFELHGAGVSADKIYDLYLRLDNDVLSRSPDMVVVYIGVNDVWHKRLLGTGTDYDKFGRFYEAIIRKLQASNIKVVLCTPAVIGERTDHSNEQDGELNLYSNWIRNHATKNGLGLVDLRRSFYGFNLEHNKENREKGVLTTDRVHLNEAGNRLVAAEMLKAIRAAYGK